MGLTSCSTGIGAALKAVKTESATGKVIALAGNPNVGKSTVFNALTGLNQHTGNWPGKTVSSASGKLEVNGSCITVVDIPGTYSLMAHSPEEEVAADFIVFAGADITAVVCDATCLERNFNLVLQTAEAFKDVIVCINLLDEAKKKGIEINFEKITLMTGLKTVGMSARQGEGIDDFVEEICGFSKKEDYLKIDYGEKIEMAVDELIPLIEPMVGEKLNARWVCLRLLEGNRYFLDKLKNEKGIALEDDEKIIEALKKIRAEGINEGFVEDMVTMRISTLAESINREAVVFKKADRNAFDRKLDRILMGKLTAIPIMLLLLAAVFFITIKGANYPSEFISSSLFAVQNRLFILFEGIGIPPKLNDFLLNGVFRVTAWVVSVMLPPMAIFFPMFTLLEDFGYLPRVAFVLDRCFKKCNACGKQALTMTMGFGCNAAGIVGARIIDSPRERLIAIITNSFVPCNGKFPALIMLISVFFASSGMTGAFVLLGVVLFGVLMTFVVSKILSVTVLKGVTSAFTLELPPFRRPRIIPVIVRSMLDRTIFVLGRAVASAVPAGALIWLMANIHVGGETLLAYFTDVLEPVGRIMGLDGVILAAFILGFPANEIVVPIMLMAYLGGGTITEIAGAETMGNIFLANGWTIKTAICTLIFFLMHWPCATSSLTAYKETKSIKWTLVTVFTPVAAGFILCCAVNFLFLLLS